MKKRATEEQLDHKRLVKLRAAVRRVWQYDTLRKRVITASSFDDTESGRKSFNCLICGLTWPIELASVDHHPDLGEFTLETFGDWTIRNFYGPMRTLCKMCHKIKKRPSKKK